MATTYFRSIGQGSITAGGADIQDWQTYTGPVHIILDKSGSGNFDYYSVDGAANTEATQTEVLPQA